MEAALRTQLHEGVAKGLKAARAGDGVWNTWGGNPWNKNLGVVVTLSSTGNVN